MYKACIPFPLSRNIWRTGGLATFLLGLPPGERNTSYFSSTALAKEAEALEFVMLFPQVLHYQEEKSTFGSCHGSSCHLREFLLSL